MIEKVYFFLDGDSIGDRLELLLLDENLEGAVKLQEDVRWAMKALQEQADTSNQIEMLMVGCDEILGRAPLNEAIKFVELARQRFLDETGFSMSAGVGNSLRDALDNLRRAKLLGKNRTYISKPIVRV